jgi:calcineurin-like phosphoesterase family protein
MNEIHRSQKYINHADNISKNSFDGSVANVFVTSDLHFSHDNIIKYCNRPFKNSDHMNSQLIKNWNSAVMPDDLVYVLGDLTMMGKDQLTKTQALVHKLNGKKILVYGNHDKFSPTDYIDMGFSSVHYPYLKYEDFYMFHDPALATACPVGSTCLCGHVHDLFTTLKTDKDNLLINVGVDVWNYTPVSLNTIKELVEARKMMEGPISKDTLDLVKEVTE